MARLNLLEETRFEKLPVTVYPDEETAAKKVARRISDLIIRKQKIGEQAILGLATGATPIGVYKELVRIHKEEGLSFKNVITFNLDEYFPMKPTSPQSYVIFMKENLFNTTKYLNKLKWIDSQTSALFTEFTLFNPNINLFMNCSVLFEIASSGSFINTTQFRSIDLYTINQSQYFSFKLALSLIFMIFMLALFVIELVKFFKLKGFN